MQCCSTSQRARGSGMRTTLSRLPIWQHATRQWNVCYATTTSGTSRRRKKQATATPADTADDLEISSSTTQPQPATVAPTVAFGKPPASTLLDHTQSWIVFSDLHVSSKTIDTSIEVLKYVHQQAKEKQAGVLFLGDFWDRRGDLPVVPLNRVQDEISSWDMPLLLLPGNHDQVDLGGLDHSLDPIKVAATEAHVFTTPAIFRGSLWLPYRRRESEVRDAISQAQQQGPLKAIFGHADVLTAHMNASYQAKDGLPPDLFPSQVPVYLGHYHYPHTVEGTSITYIGSPYQVSSSEAGQQKRLLLLDHNWQIISEIPVNLGRRFWNFSTTIPAAAATSDSSSSSGDESSSITDTEGTLDITAAAAVAAAAAGEVGVSNPMPSARFLLQPEIVRDLLDRGDLRSGDVAHLRIDEENEESLQIQKMLAKEGVQVQLHIHAKAKPVARIAAAEQLSMQQLLEQYSATTGMRGEVLDCARQVLKELGSRSSETPQHSYLELDSVSVQGFGPFKGAVDYPLADRGVVAVTGRNEDDAAAVSNGAGKTSLLTSLLWAFKVDDSRDMTAAAYVNEDSKSAAVTVRGSINKKPFELVRSTTGGLRPKGSLSLTVDGQELTGQEQRLTEKTLESMFSTTLLPKTMVFTQEKLLMLLQSNDALFKEQLSSVVDTKCWEEAKDIAKQYRSQHEAKRSEIEILEKECRQNIGRASDDLDRLQDLSKIWEQQQQQQQASAVQREQSALQQVHSTAHDMHSLQQQISAALAAAGQQQQSLQSAVAAAHTAALSTAQQLTQQQQQQQQEGDDSTTLNSSSSSSNVLDQKLDLEYDQVAAAAGLRALRLIEQEFADLVTAQQDVVSELKGQLKAANKRLSKFQKLQKHTHAAAMPTAAAASSSRGDGDDSVAAAAAVHGGSDGGVKLICEQCLQPINLELYQKNLDNMAADEQLIQQQIDEASQLLEQYKEEHTAAQQQRLQLQQQQEQDKQKILAARERLMSERAAAETAARRAAEDARRREQQQAQEQQRQQQQLFEEERKLQGQLTRLQQAMQVAQSLSTQLTDKLTYISNKLQLPALINISSSSGSSNLDTQPAAAAMVNLQDVMRLLQQCNNESQLCEELTAAGDSVVAARGVLERLAEAQNPYLSGVNQAHRALEEQQQRLQESEQQMYTVSKQVDLWKRVYVAFGRTGIPSFLTEDALNQLQLACSRHLTQLASGMALELSATSVKSGGKKSNVKSAGKKAGTGAKKKAAKSAASSDVAATAITLDQADSSDPAISALRSRDLDLDLDQEQITDLADGGSIKAADLDADVAAADLKEEISKIVRVRSAGGELRQRSIAQLSGGEKKRVALALGLGFAELVAARSRLASNVLILDEVLEKLDDEGCACVAQVLRRLPYSSVFVVGQVNSFVTNEFATVDTVVKSGGCATVELGVQQQVVARRLSRSSIV